MSEKDQAQKLAKLIYEGRQIAGAMIAQRLGLLWTDGEVINLHDANETLVMDGVEYTTAPLNEGETPTRVVGHTGVWGKENGAAGTLSEQNLWRWLETPTGEVKRFRVKRTT